ncbi:MAG: MFS transporter [Chloroflexi bacterium]|nr:MFS transporter [Chloroflexota bacterium]
MPAGPEPATLTRRGARRPGWGEPGRANAAVFLLNIGEAVASTLTAAYLRSRGYPLSEIGLLVGAYAVASLISRIPAGKLADRPTSRRWFTLACVFTAGTFALYPFAPGAAWFLAVRLLHGFFSGMTSTLNFATFLGVATGRNRLHATAHYTAFMSGGFATGNILSGLVADNLGYTAAFLLAALCPGLALLAAPHAAPTAGVAARVTDAAAPDPAASTLFRADVVAIPALAFAVNFTHQAVGTLFPLYALSIGQSLTVVGSARAVQSTANTVIRPFGGWLLRILGLVGLACSGILLQGFGVAALPMTSSALAISALFLLVGMGRGFGVVANALSTAQMTSRGVLKRGTASTLASMGSDSAAVIAPVVSGFSAAALGIGPALQVLTAASTLAGLTVMVLARKGLQSEPAEPG